MARSRSHLVFTGAEPSIYSPYATQNATTYQAHMVPAAKWKNMDASASAYMHDASLPLRGGEGEGVRLPLRCESPPLSAATSSRFSWAGATMPSPPATAAMPRNAKEPRFCEEPNASDRIMPKEASPKQRFAGQATSPPFAFRFLKEVDRGPNPGGFCKGNDQGSTVRGLVAPAPGGPGGPVLTRAQQKRLAEDSSRRLALSRDHYDDRFVTANMYFINDAASQGGSQGVTGAGHAQERAGSFQPLSHPGPVATTGPSRECTKPVYRASKSPPLEPHASPPSGHAYMPPQSPEGKGVKLMTGFSASMPTGATMIQDPMGESSALSPSPTKRLQWKQKVTETGLGPHGIDTLRASEANMYQSIQRVEMGRRPPPQVDRVLRSPTRSSGYLRSREPGFNEHDGATMSFYGQ